MIYDCFLFFNELKILELRLAELDTVVDRFVLVEGTKTFSGKPKPLYFHESRHLFLRYLHKITHVVVDDMPSDMESAWGAEAFQRNAMLRGLESAGPNDVVIISDVDEIPRASTVESFTPPMAALELQYFYFALNCKNLAGNWVGPVMAARNEITSPQEVRMLARRYWRTGVRVLNHAGWHFSFIHDSGGVQHKIEAFSHQEYNTLEYKDPARIQDRLKFGLDIFDRRDHYWCAVPVDETFPSAIREHTERFQDLLFDFTRFQEARQDLIYSLEDELARTSEFLGECERQLAEAKTQIQELTGMWSRGTRWTRVALGAATAPLDWLAGAVVISGELLGRLVRGAIGRRNAPSLAPKNRQKCSIIIVTWQGKDLLAESLPALLGAVKFEGGEHEVIVVDNGSTDGTQEFVRTQFPEVRLVRSEQNLYFGGGNNLGVQAANSDILVLLNNDMIVHEDFLAPLLDPFHAPDVFAVASQVFLADSRKRREETGKTRVSINGSELEWRHEEILPGDEQQGYVPVFWGHGGAVAIDRQKFLWLGGFDPLFDPFYVEDADISYAAWKVGWRCLLAVHSKVIHKHRSSTSRFGKQFITQIVRRNQYLFLWKHFTDLDKLWAHFLRAFQGRMRRAGIAGIGVRLEATALLGAAKRLPTILRRRLRMARYVRRRDQDILDLIGSPADDAIQSPEIDFSKASFAEQLGSGWYDREVRNGKSFRWMGPQASVFLRAPLAPATLVVKAFVPALASYRSRPLTLTIRCLGQLKQIPLKEGGLDYRWPMPGLPSGVPVEVGLSVSQTIESEGDSRKLALVVESIGFMVEGRRPRKRETVPEKVVLSSRRSAAPDTASQACILMVCAYLPARGLHGGANMMFNLIRSLSKRHRLTVLSFYENEAELQYVPELSQYCETLEVIYRGQTFEEGNLFGVKPPDIIHEFHHLRMARLIRRYLSTKQFDILQCEFLYTAHLAALAPDVPAVLTHHEVLSLSCENNYRRLRWLERGKLKALIAWMRILNYEEKVLRRMSAVVVLTRPEAEFLERLNPGVRVYARPMGVDCEYFTPEPRCDSKTVIFVGNFRHSPNVSGALWLLREIWPRVHREVPDARLMIVGGEPDVRMKEFAGRDNVTLTGWVQDVRPYLNEASVVVASVFEGAGMRTKVLEAWAMQKPVVGTSLSFEGLITGSGEFGYIGDETEQFADGMKRLLSDPELARSMGQRARRFVQQNFSWETFADTYDRIYSEVLGAYKRHGQGTKNKPATEALVEKEELQEQRYAR